MALDVVDQLVRSNAVDMVVVDSVAALVPRAELEGEMADMQMGLQARLMSKVGVALLPRGRKRGQQYDKTRQVKRCNRSGMRLCICLHTPVAGVSQACSSPRWMCLSYVLIKSAERTASVCVCS